MRYALCFTMGRAALVPERAAPLPNTPWSHHRLSGWTIPLSAHQELYPVPTRNALGPDQDKYYNSAQCCPKPCECYGSVGSPANAKGKDTT